MAKLQNLKSTDVVRNCVIPRRLVNFASPVEIKPKFINVHALSFSNVGSLRQSGDIIRSTICEWKCAGSNRFQNCALEGSAIRSTFGLLFAGDEASLAISGPKFKNNVVNTIRSEKDISIGNKDGFDSNTVKSLSSPNGRLFSVLGTSITNNRFDQFNTGAISSFADIDANTAGVVFAKGPCVVSQVKSRIAVEDMLTLPDGDRDCARIYEKV